MEKFSTDAIKTETGSNIIAITRQFAYFLTLCYNVDLLYLSQTTYKKL